MISPRVARPRSLAAVRSLTSDSISHGRSLQPTSNEHIESVRHRNVHNTQRCCRKGDRSGDIGCGSGGRQSGSPQSPVLLRNCHRNQRGILHRRASFFHIRVVRGLRASGALWVFSEEPHAAIRFVDVDQARQVDGVLAILTARDVPVNEYALETPDQTCTVRSGVREAVRGESPVHR